MRRHHTGGSARGPAPLEPNRSGACCVRISGGVGGADDLPGDVIATGTTAGVGVAMTPPQYLRPGDVVAVEIESIGVLRTPIVKPDEYR
ncbi:fumarylacetoacetate hydrolase family protein [Embleya sp. AB8]|uniref:fumarylacetoacetate hydrolase family protein n=1 Tax=Embleya sp. AB8 TaxID=3156304 RepID=UPI003C739B34